MARSISDDKQVGRTETISARLEKLIQGGIRISERHTLARVLQEIADSAREVTGARYAALGILEHGGGALAEFVSSGLSDEERHRIGALPSGKGVLAVMLAAQAAVAVENTRLYEETARLLGEVQAMQRSRDRFYAMINHELRNALTAVYGWSDLLMRKLGADAPLAAREVYESAERTLGLLNDLLDLRRLDASKL